MIRSIICIFLFTFSQLTVLADIRIGVLIPMSGTYADLGEDCRHGIEIARSFSGNTTSTLIYADSKGESRTAVAEFNRLVNQDNVHTVVTIRSPVGMAINPLSKQRKIPIVGSVGNAKFPLENPYAFQFWTTTTYEGQTLASHFKKLGIKRLSLLTAEDDWTVAVSDALVDSFSKLEGVNVLNELIPTTETDMLPTLSKIKRFYPDGIFVNLGISQLATTIKRIKELKISSKIYSNMWIGKKEVIESAGLTSLQGATYIEGKDDFPTFRKNFDSLFPGSASSFMTFSCYTSTMFLLQSAKKTGDNLTSESLYNTMKTESEVSLKDESIKITNRVAQFELECKTFKFSEISKSSCY